MDYRGRSLARHKGTRMKQRILKYSMQTVSVGIFLREAPGGGVERSGEMGVRRRATLEVDSLFCGLTELQYQ